MNRVLGRLRAVDFYRRIPKDLTEATLAGGALSIVAAVAMIFLFGMELQAFLQTSATTTVIIDRSRDGDVMRINFNFSFPALSCEFASVDVSDVLGTHRINLSKTVRKFPIDQAGRITGPEFHHIAHTVQEPAHDPIDEGTAEMEAIEGRQLAEGDGNPGGNPGGNSGGNTDGDPSTAAGLPDKKPDGALVLTEATFDIITKESVPIVMVNFYAPWCPWSQRLEPVWETSAKTMLEKYPVDVNPKILLAKVDCTVEVALCRKHHVQGFPSIRIFRSGQDVRANHGHHDHESYYGDRTEAAISQFADDLASGLQQRAFALPGATAQQVVPPWMGKDGRALRVVAKAPQSSGCQIEGFVLVKKVPGNLQVAAVSAGHSFDPATMNMSHSVNAFSFGRKPTVKQFHEIDRIWEHHPTAGEDRLTGRYFHSHGDNLTHEHYLQVVLTTVEPLKLPQHQYVQSYDYTAHSNSFHSADVPVAKFHYELSPMQVVITENKRSFSHFITNMCAIIGGVFTVAGILDSIAFETARAFKKTQLGKQF